MRKSTKAAIGITGVVAIAAISFCAASYALDRHLLAQTYARSSSDDLPFILTDADIAADYPYQDVEFQLDGATLRGHVYGADNDRGLIVFRHGVFSHHQDYLALITALVDKGWKVFAYDAIGCGESDGDSIIGFAQSPLDVRAAVRFACDSGMADGLPIVLVGHSWGGYGVAGALDFEDVRERVSACVAMSGFDTSTGVILETAERQMGAIVRTQGPFIDLIERLDFGADAGRSASRAVNACGLPVMVVHGTEDQVVSFDGASIMAGLDSSENPLVTRVVESDPGHDGHNTYFYSPESQAYLSECFDRYSELQDEYGGTLPPDVKAAFLDDVDKRRANTADPDLIGQIDAFLGAAVK